MYKDQGIAGFYRGVNVNVMRAITLSGTKMAVYDVSKGQVVKATGWNRANRNIIHMNIINRPIVHNR